jgi:general secretion pathway protein G
VRRVVGLVVAALAGLALVAVALRCRPRRSEEGVPAVRVQIEMLGTALDTLRCDVGRYPTDDEGLRALRERPAGMEGWNGPYLVRDVPADPWNRPYLYRSTGDAYELSSLGADGRPRGRGDDLDEVGTPVPWDQRDVACPPRGAAAAPRPAIR